MRNASIYCFLSFFNGLAKVLKAACGNIARTALPAGVRAFGLPVQRGNGEDGSWAGYSSSPFSIRRRR